MFQLSSEYYYDDVALSEGEFGVLEVDFDDNDSLKDASDSLTLDLTTEFTNISNDVDKEIDNIS